MTEAPDETISPALPTTPRAGVLIHLSALPGAHGIGDIGDAAQAFLERLAGMSLGAWQFLPLGPTGYGDSPYQPLSAFAGNERLVGLGPLVRAGLLRSDEVEPLAALPRDRVDYDHAGPHRLALLGRAAERLHAAGDRAARDAFVDRHDRAWLDDYALYRVLKHGHDEHAWSTWDEEWRRRDPAALQRLRGRERDAIERIKTVQFLFDQQWQDLRRRAQELDIILVSDLPIYLAGDSADAWARPEGLSLDRDGRADRVAGVPPDYFSNDGQLWGNPVYNWSWHAADGYRWWVERVRHEHRRADLVRIDHFRGFESYWSVAATAETARDGCWEQGPGDALFAAIEAELGELPIIAEDLGLITPEVTALRRRHCIPGMHVLQFALADPDFEPDVIGPNSVCYTGTHDNDTTVGWFAGGPGDPRDEEEIRQTRERALRLTGGSPATIHLDLARLALGTASRITVIPMADWLGLGPEGRFNTPGTTAHNWCWRLREEQLTAHLRETVRTMVSETGRSP